MKPISLLILTILIALKVNAADSTGRERTDEPFTAVKLGATTISILIPIVQLGIEHRWKNYSWLAGTGFIIPRQYNIDNSIKGTALGGLLRVGIRKHNHTPSHSGVFIGLNLFYTGFKYPHTIYFNDTPLVNGVSQDVEDHYLLIKHTIGGVFEFGGHHYIGRRVDIETSLGIGIKLMFTSQQGRKYPSFAYETRHPTTDAIEGRLGQTSAMALQAQISVGYKLGSGNKKAPHRGS